MNASTSPTEGSERDLSILNPNPQLLPGPRLLHELVLQDYVEYPALDYLSAEGDRITVSYKDVHLASDSLAARISSILRSTTSDADGDGAEKPLVVPVLAPQSPALYIAFLAILKIGAAFCPLNLDAPPDRVNFILQDVGARVVLVHDPAEDLAYVMYTSGSTGTPKGVGISHLAVTQALLAHDRHIPPFKRFLQFAAPTFDVSVFEIFFPLFRGATLVCCDRRVMLNDLPLILNEMEVDACELTPSVAGSLLKTRNKAPGLQLLLTIGEMLTEPVIEEFGGDTTQPSMLWGMYGPTEATIHCTLQPAFSKESGKQTIGVPLDTCSAFIIRTDEQEKPRHDFQVLPRGQIGELAIGGYQLATAYINRPEQTAASFVETPWGRAYKTGDKAVMRPDGIIECLGRISDGQVKLNGQRLELGEVEHAVLRTPGCHGSFAAVIGNTLVVFAAVDDPASRRDDILAQCKAWLPAFMIPSDVVTMSSLPLLPSGKVDRKGLIHDYEKSMMHQGWEDGDFEDDVERHICEEASRILGRTVAPLTQFSSAQLDSLAAIEYASALRNGGLDADPVAILSALTPRDLWHVIRERRAAREAAGEVTRLDPRHSPSMPRTNAEEEASYMERLAGELGVDVQQIERVEPCTSLQASMIAETMKDPRLYINEVEFGFPAGVTWDLIRSSLLEIIQRNEILRTGFAYMNDELVQVIWKQLDDCQIACGTESEDQSPNDDAIQNFLRHPLKIVIKPMEQSLEQPLGHSAQRSSALLTLHHAIYDGWTLDLVAEDLALMITGSPPADRPQFQEITGFHARYMATEKLDDREYWSALLHGCSTARTPNFKTCAVPQHQITTISEQLQLDPAKVKAGASQLSVSPQVIFQAGLCWLWAAVCGLDDITIGSVSSGRALPLAEVERIMGPCMATLPLRVKLKHFSTISELLQGIQTTNRDMLRHGTLPLADIKRAADLGANSDLFHVIFVYQETLVSRKRTSSGVSELWHKDNSEAKLLVEIQPGDDCFTCQVTWHTDVFSEAQVRAFTHELDHLTAYMTSNAGETIDSIPQSFPVEDLSRYNVKPRKLRIPSSLAELVEATVQQHPENEAVLFATSLNEHEPEHEPEPTEESQMHTLTYRQLNARANQVARFLQRHGARSGGIVAIVMEKSPLLYCCILGILKAGCAYLPALPSTPLQRTRLILEQAQPQCCLVEATSSLLKEQGFPCAVVGVEESRLREYADEDLKIPCDPFSLAYIIYTSGTTGTPKGVAVTHGNMLSNIEALSSIYPHSPSDKMLQACSQAFDVSVFEIFFAWGTGMCLCAATNDTLFEDFERSVRLLGVTHLSMTVTVASLLRPAYVPNVKFLVTSGEPMTDEVLEKWSEQLYQVKKGDSSQYLGWSFENTSTFVFYPDTLLPVPLGCVGELCFGGDQVAAGYLGMPDMTAAKFIVHPDYGRLYRSGDLGRMLPDGSLVILGRIDTQIKLRGLRIELQEIQALVLRSGLARSCVCVPLTARRESPRQLALFYVPSDYETTTAFAMLPLDGQRETTMCLWEVLRSTLPDYMVPSFIFPVSALPRTASGKLDVEELQRSVSGLPDHVLSLCSLVLDEADDRSEWTQPESQVASALSQTLHVDQRTIGRWASFASLGLDSISAISFAQKLQTVFQKRVPLSLVLQKPSVGRLALAISCSDTSASLQHRASRWLPQRLIDTIHEGLSSQGLSVAEVMPCTPLQEAMLASSSASSAAYFNHMVFQLRVPSQVMVSHWNKMVERHEILRACFVSTNELEYPIAQAVLKSFEPAWQFLDWDSLDFGDSFDFQQVAALQMTSLAPVLDSSHPPVSLAVIRTKNGPEYLSFVCHHAIYDGIAMKTLLSEVETLHRGERLPVPVSFKPFLQATIPLSFDEDGFWNRQLAGFHPSTVKQSGLQDCTGSDVRTVTTQASSIPLSSLKAQLQDLGISLLSLCQAAWAITLSLVQETGDVCFGNVVSGRSLMLDHLDHINHLVAPCFNTLPFRADLGRATSILDAAKKLQTLNAETIPYQFSSLRRIQAKITPQTRLFDTVFILQPPPEPLDEDIWHLDHEYGSMDVPLVCEMVPSTTDDTLQLLVHRDPSAVSFEFLELARDMVSYVIDDAVSHPSGHIPTSARLPGPLQARLTEQRQFTSDRLSTQARMTSNGGVWDAVQSGVRAVLSKLTKIPERDIGLDVPIYRYGLDSIGAVQLATLLRQQGIAVSAVDVIENPTCAGIASRSRAAEASASGQKEKQAYNFEAFRADVREDLDEAGLASENIEAVLPCTPTQQGMVSQFLSSSGKLYFNYISWALEPGTDPERVVEAWRVLDARHQILRTGFIEISHHDSSFAMVVYKTDCLKAPVTLHRHGLFSRDDFRARAASDVLRTVPKPCWRLHPATMHLAIHHAVYDEFSLRNLMKELACVLSGSEMGVSQSLQPVLSDVLHAATPTPEVEGFWKNQATRASFNRFPNMTPLQIKDGQAVRLSRTCLESSQAVRHAAAKAGVTLQAGLQAAWARLLAAYIGESNVTFGVVLDGRTTDLARSSMLPLISTLPVVSQHSSSNEEALRYMMEYNRRLRRHEHVPLSRIQRWLGRPDNPLFDTILVYQTADHEADSLPWKVQDEVGSVDYTISLDIEDTVSGPLRFNIVCNGSVVPTEQAEILLSQFELILLHMLFKSTGSDAELIISEPELFSILPAQCEEIPMGVTLVHELVERSALRTPQAIALEFADDIGYPPRTRMWTYQQLNDMGSRVANLILQHNIQPGSIVATRFDKCPAAYFAILGILKAGCAFLCLDPGAPASRHEFILADSEATLLLVEPVEDGWAGEAYSGLNIPVIELSEAQIMEFPSRLPQDAPAVSPSDTCYCLYTSGTTGTPKGCLISHDNVVQAMGAFEQLFAGHWTSDSRWLQFASFHFDVSVLEQYWSWHVGITVVAAPKDVILSDLASSISRLAITHIDLTPSLARLIHPDEVPSLCEGVFITGGEQLRQEILQAWGPKRVIYNAYGPTEATIGVTMHLRVPENGKASNIGQQFPNVGSVVLVPGTETPVLRGGVGELCVSGRLVGKGYLKREELTEERFPVLKSHGTRVYRTGDLVRVLADGSFDFLGRADDQVKLRGQRLEIGEINHSIKTGLADTIADVATIVAKRGGQDRELLVSFVSPANRKGQTVQTAQTAQVAQAEGIRILTDPACLDICLAAQEACRGRLPNYMVPTYVLCIPLIPLSPNNKADIGQLKRLFADLPNEDLQNLASRVKDTRRALDERERAVARAILTTVQSQETIDSISSSSTVFELGIDSITAPRLARQLHAAGFISASASLILQHPQISELCEALYAVKRDTQSDESFQAKRRIQACYHRHLGTASVMLGIEADAIEYITPCTPLQEGMLARSSTSEDTSAYFNQVQFDISTPTSTDASLGKLRASWEQEVASSSILRSAFLQVEDGYIQVAISPGHSSLRWFDVTVDAESLEETISMRHKAWVTANRPVLRSPVEVDHLESAGQHTLVLRLYHAVYDAHSFDIILRSVNERYHDLLPTRGPSFLDALPHGPLLSHRRSRPFWKVLFHGQVYRPLPSLTSSVSSSDSSVTRNVQFPGLEARRKALHVTHQTVLQATWLLALHRHLGRYPTIGVVFAGRSLPLLAIEDVVGPLFNTLPFRVQVDDGMTWASLVTAVQQYNTTVLNFVHTPLRDIQKWCSNGRALFDTLFSFGVEPERSESTAEEHGTWWSSVSTAGDLDYPLAFEAILNPDNTFKLTIAAQGHIANEATLQRMLDTFIELLQGFGVSDNTTAVPEATSFEPARPVTPMSVGTSEISTPPMNTPSSTASGFIWTDKARQIQQELASLAEVDAQTITETTNIFELGLDSIDAIKLASRLTRLGLSVSASKLMKTSTVESIMSLPELHVTQDTDKADEADTYPTTHDMDETISRIRACLERAGMDFQDVTAVLPPTPLQDSMVADMILSDFHRYFNHDVLELPADVDIGRLKEAWCSVYASSPILRTSFAEIDDPKVDSAYCQVVRTSQLQFGRDETIESLDEIEALLEAARQRAAAARGASDLFQLQLARISSKTYLVLSIAHALYDGWSLDMLHRDAQAAYHGLHRKRPAYEAYLSRILQGSGSSAKRFWTDYLAGVRPTLLRPRNDAVHHDQPAQAAQVHRAELASSLRAADIKALCQAYHITPQVLGLACWATVLASLSRSLEVTFGVVLSGRDTEEAEELLFPTMNTFLSYLQGGLAGVMEFKHTSLRQAQALARVSRGPHPETESLPRSVRSASSVEYPVCVELGLSPGQVSWQIACDDRFLESSLRYFAEHRDAAILKFHPQARELDDGPGMQPQSGGNDLPARETPPSTAEPPAPLLDVLSELSGSIYHLGLDSISAIKACAMLRKRGVALSIRQLLEAASIRGIRPPPPPRRDVGASLGDPRRLARKAGLPPDAVERILPALPAQAYLLSGWQASGGRLFSATFAFACSRAVAPDAVARAWASLVAELPVLRAHFLATEAPAAPFAQVIAKPGRPPRQNWTLAGDAEAWELRCTSTPWVGLRAAKCRDQTPTLLLRIHHALYDGVSLPLVVQRLAALCGASPGSVDASSPDAWFAFAAGHIEPGAVDRRRQFWTSYLRGAESVLFSGLPGTLADTARTEVFREGVVSDISTLGKIGARHGVSLQALFFAACSRVLARLRHSPDTATATITATEEEVIFGVYFANRGLLPATTPLPTLNILPLRVRGPRARGLLALAADIQRDLVAIGDPAHATAALWEIDAWTGVRVDACVNFLALPDGGGGRPLPPRDDGDAQLRLRPTQDPTATADLLDGLARPDDARVRPNRVAGSYMNTLDIEAAVRGDALDVGVFSGLSRAQAEGLIDNLVSTLRTAWETEGRCVADTD
ncbi:amino acid adenylation domain-containing protein [Xylariomycetidae sp. FL0641]|nr:amino acid adenylation domain-containing protein [Xylariomycetidae sp. FL0641]